jgi:hypothetical protein
LEPLLPGQSSLRKPGEPAPKYELDDQGNFKRQTPFFSLDQELVQMRDQKLKKIA